MDGSGTEGGFCGAHGAVEWVVFVTVARASDTLRHLGQRGVVRRSLLGEERPGGVFGANTREPGTAGNYGLPLESEWLSSRNLPDLHGREDIHAQQPMVVRVEYVPSENVTAIPTNVCSK